MDNNTLIEWIKEVNTEMLNTQKMIGATRDELKDEIAKNREEFIIFKTTINTRTAFISGAIGLLALIISIGINIGDIKNRVYKDKTNTSPVEQVDNIKTE